MKFLLLPISILGGIVAGLIATKISRRYGA